MYKIAPVCEAKDLDTYTFIGDFKNPIAVGTYRDIYSNLDEEFYQILELWRLFRAGLIDLDISEISYKISLSLRYLIEDDLSRRAV